MINIPIAEIADKYGWENYSIKQLKSGLINYTFQVTTSNSIYIVQKINTTIFQDPQAIDANLISLNSYFQKNFKNYLFIGPLCSINGLSLHKIGPDYFRVFEYVQNSETKTVVKNADEAFEAAKQFGQFTFLLKEFDASKLNLIIPNFHNLSLRIKQFKNALIDGNIERIIEAKDLIRFIEEQYSISSTYENFIANATIRVTHHDTKISNVLFNQENKAICIIDLDTIMPGYFLSDVGDMIRTYVCPASEEETDFSKIIIRKDVLQAIQDGYYTFMENELTKFEKSHFFFAGEMMIYMQAIRFLSDYFNNDIYYHTNYPKQNLNRAKNQLFLLKALQKSMVNQ